MFLGIERVGSQRRINKDQVIAADQAIGSNTDEIVELNKKIRQLEIDNSNKIAILTNTAKKLDDAIRTKMEIEESNEVQRQQLNQLQDLQSSQKKIMDTLNEQILVLEEKNIQATNDLIAANETIQKLRAEKEIEIRKVIHIAKKLDDAIHTKMNSEEELEETQARMRELESELIMSRKGSIDSSTFSGLVLSRSEEFSVSEKYENMSELSSPGKAPEANPSNPYDNVDSKQPDDEDLVRALQVEVEALKSELSHYKDSNGSIVHTPTGTPLTDTCIKDKSLVEVQKVPEILQHTPKPTPAPVNIESKEMYDWSREELIFELIEQKVRHALVSFELEEKTGKLHSLLQRIKQHQGKKN